MAVYFTSDHHLYHRAMTFLRRYGHWPRTEEERASVTQEDIDWHNEMLADKWGSVVRKKDDLVIVVGDCTANSKSVPEAIQWYKQRPGVKRLVPGNHDPVHAMHSDSNKWHKMYLEAFDSIELFATRKISLGPNKVQRVLISHFPYTGDGDLKEDRDTQFRLRNEGLPLLHGHVHTKDQVTHSPMGPAQVPVKQIHVGVDAWDFAPVSLDEIVELLK